LQFAPRCPAAPDPLTVEVDLDRLRNRVCLGGGWHAVASRSADR
jgi:hypothetical protein